MLITQPPSFCAQSVESFGEYHGEPETVTVSRINGRTLTNNVPPVVTLPLVLDKEAPEFDLKDARDLILSDFGETFSPATETRLGRNCNPPVSSRAPEAVFEPDSPLGYSSDAWSLGLAIWDILGMKFLFSQESSDENEVVAQRIETLGSTGPPPKCARRGIGRLRTTASMNRYPAEERLRAAANLGLFSRTPLKA